MTHSSASLFTLGLVTAAVYISVVMAAVGTDFFGFKCIRVYTGTIIVFFFVLNASESGEGSNHVVICIWMVGISSWGM